MRADPDPVAGTGRSAERGFTLVELSIVMVVLLPVLLIVSNTTSVATRAVNTNDRIADVSDALARSAQRVAQLLRPAKLSTVQMLSDATDVALGRATAVGEWIEPVDLEWRNGLRFEAAQGLLSMNASLSTSPRTIRYVVDANELTDGIDNDGDQYVDEGALSLTYDGVTLNLADQFELAQFALDGRIVRMRLRFARQDATRRVHRAYIEQSFYMRNN